MKSAYRTITAVSWCSNLDNVKWVNQALIYILNHEKNNKEKLEGQQPDKCDFLQEKKQKFIQYLCNSQDNRVFSHRKGPI